MERNNVVTVLEITGYHEPEPTPFQAIVIGVYESGILVKSLKTERGYELQEKQLFYCGECEKHVRNTNLPVRCDKCKAVNIIMDKDVDYKREEDEAK